MNCIALLLGLVVIAPGPVAPPPMLDFETRVDYRSWYDQQVQVTAGENALDMYGVFLFPPKDSPNASLAPKTGTPAATQLRALMSRGQIWRVGGNRELATWMADVEANCLRSFEDGAERRTYAPRPAPGVKLIADIKAPNLANARAVGEMMFGRAWLAGGGAIYTDHFVTAVRTNLALCNHIRKGVTLEDQLFCNGHRELIYRQVRHAMRNAIYTPEISRRIAVEIERFDGEPLPPQLARYLSLAEARSLQLLQHFCTTYGPGGQAEISPQVNPQTANAYLVSRFGKALRRARNTDALLEADPRELAAAVHRYYEGLRGIVANADAPDLQNRIQQINTTTLDKYPALNTLLLRMDFPIEGLYRAEALRRMAYVFLHQAIVFKETNVWPQDFTELHFPNMASYRHDPFSGKDFLFVKRQSRTAVYSVGPDGVDDGGDKDKDIVYWSVVRRMGTPIGSPDEAGTNGAAGDEEADTAVEPSEKAPANAATTDPPAAP